MWSLGVVLYKLLSRKYPYVGADNVLIMKAVCKKNVCFPSNMKIKYVMIIKKMLNKNPEKRPSVKDILKWFGIVN